MDDPEDRQSSGLLRSESFSDTEASSPISNERVPISLPMRSIARNEPSEHLPVIEYLCEIPEDEFPFALDQKMEEIDFNYVYFPAWAPLLERFDIIFERSVRTLLSTYAFLPLKLPSRCNPIASISAVDDSIVISSARFLSQMARFGRQNTLCPSVDLLTLLLAHSNVGLVSACMDALVQFARRRRPLPSVIDSFSDVWLEIAEQWQPSKFSDSISSFLENSPTELSEAFSFSFSSNDEESSPEANSCVDICLRPELSISENFDLSLRMLRASPSDVDHCDDVGSSNVEFMANAASSLSEKENHPKGISSKNIFRLWSVIRARYCLQNASDRLSILAAYFSVLQIQCLTLRPCFSSDEVEKIVEFLENWSDPFHQTTIQIGAIGALSSCALGIIQGNAALSGSQFSTLLSLGEYHGFLSTRFRTVCEMMEGGQMDHTPICIIYSIEVISMLMSSFRLVSLQRFVNSGLFKDCLSALQNPREEMFPLIISILRMLEEISVSSDSLAEQLHSDGIFSQAISNIHTLSEKIISMDFRREGNGSSVCLFRARFSSILRDHFMFLQSRFRLDSAFQSSIIRESNIVESIANILDHSTLFDVEPVGQGLYTLGLMFNLDVSLVSHYAEETDILLRVLQFLEYSAVAWSSSCLAFIPTILHSICVRPEFLDMVKVLNPIERSFRSLMSSDLYFEFSSTITERHIESVSHIGKTLAELYAQYDTLHECGTESIKEAIQSLREFKEEQSIASTAECADMEFIASTADRIRLCSALLESILSQSPFGSVFFSHDGASSLVDLCEIGELPDNRLHRVLRPLFGDGPPNGFSRSSRMSRGTDPIQRASALDLSSTCLSRLLSHLDSAFHASERWDKPLSAPFIPFHADLRAVNKLSSMYITLFRIRHRRNQSPIDPEEESYICEVLTRSCKLCREVLPLLLIDECSSVFEMQSLNLRLGETTSSAQSSSQEEGDMPVSNSHNVDTEEGDSVLPSPVSEVSRSDKFSKLQRDQRKRIRNDIAEFTDRVIQLFNVFCRFAVGIVERSSSSGSVSMPIAKALASGFSELISDFDSLRGHLLCGEYLGIVLSLLHTTLVHEHGSMVNAPLLAALCEKNFFYSLWGVLGHLVEKSTSLHEIHNLAKVFFSKIPSTDASTSSVSTSTSSCRILRSFEIPKESETTLLMSRISRIQSRFFPNQTRPTHFIQKCMDWILGDWWSIWDILRTVSSSAVLTNSFSLRNMVSQNLFSESLTQIPFTFSHLSGSLLSDFSEVMQASKEGLAFGNRFLPPVIQFMAHLVPQLQLKTVWTSLFPSRRPSYSSGYLAEEPLAPVSQPWRSFDVQSPSRMDAAPRGRMVPDERDVDASNRIPSPRRIVLPDPQALEQLIQMGFDAEHSGRALVASSNDLVAAMDWLVSNPLPSNEEDGPDSDLSAAIAASLENSAASIPASQYASSDLFRLDSAALSSNLSSDASVLDSNQFLEILQRAISSSLIGSPESGRVSEGNGGQQPVESMSDSASISRPLDNFSILEQPISSSSSVPDDPSIFPNESESNIASFGGEDFYDDDDDEALAQALALSVESASSQSQLSSPHCCQEGHDMDDMVSPFHATNDVSDDNPDSVDPTCDETLDEDEFLQEIEDIDERVHADDMPTSSLESQASNEDGQNVDRIPDSEINNDQSSSVSSNRRRLMPQDFSSKKVIPFGEKFVTSLLDIASLSSDLSPVCADALKFISQDAGLRELVASSLLDRILHYSEVDTTSFSRAGDLALLCLLMSNNADFKTFFLSSFVQPGERQPCSSSSATKKNGTSCLSASLIEEIRVSVAESVALAGSQESQMDRDFLLEWIFYTLSEMIDFRWCENIQSCLRQVEQVSLSSTSNDDAQSSHNVPCSSSMEVESIRDDSLCPQFADGRETQSMVVCLRLILVILQNSSCFSPKVLTSALQFLSTVSSSSSLHSLFKDEDEIVNEQNVTSSHNSWIPASRYVESVIHAIFEIRLKDDVPSNFISCMIRHCSQILYNLTLTKQMFRYALDRSVTSWFQRPNHRSRGTVKPLDEFLKTFLPIAVRDFRTFLEEIPQLCVLVDAGVRRRERFGDEVESSLRRFDQLKSDVSAVIEYIARPVLSLVLSSVREELQDEKSVVSSRSLFNSSNAVQYFSRLVSTDPLGCPWLFSIGDLLSTQESDGEILLSLVFEEVFTLPQSILSSSSSLQTLQNECLQLVKILSPRYMPIVLSHLSRALEKLQISKEYHGLLSVIAELLPGLCLASRVGSDSLGHFIRRFEECDLHTRIVDALSYIPLEQIELKHLELLFGAYQMIYKPSHYFRSIRAKRSKQSENDDRKVHSSEYKNTTEPLTSSQPLPEAGLSADIALSNNNPLPQVSDHGDEISSDTSSFAGNAGFSHDYLDSEESQERHEIEIVFQNRNGQDVIRLTRVRSLSDSIQDTNSSSFHESSDFADASLYPIADDGDDAHSNEDDDDEDEDEDEVESAEEVDEDADGVHNPFGNDVNLDHESEGEGDHDLLGQENIDEEDPEQNVDADDDDDEEEDDTGDGDDDDDDDDEENMNQDFEGHHFRTGMDEDTDEEEVEVDGIVDNMGDIVEEEDEGSPVVEAFEFAVEQLFDNGLLLPDQIRQNGRPGGGSGSSRMQNLYSHLLSSESSARSDLSGAGNFSTNLMNSVSSPYEPLSAPNVDGSQSFSISSFDRPGIPNRRRSSVSSGGLHRRQFVVSPGLALLDLSLSLLTLNELNSACIPILRQVLAAAAELEQQSRELSQLAERRRAELEEEKKPAIESSTSSSATLSLHENVLSEESNAIDSTTNPQMNPSLHEQESSSDSRLEVEVSSSSVPPVNDEESNHSVPTEESSAEVNSSSPEVDEEEQFILSRIEPLRELFPDLDSETLRALARSDIDPEFLAELPDEMRSEVLASERQRILSSLPSNPDSESRPGDGPSSGLFDDPTTQFLFLSELPADVREEIFVTMDDSSIAALPDILRQEAEAVRARGAAQFYRSAPRAVPRSGARFISEYGEESDLNPSLLPPYLSMRARRQDHRGLPAKRSVAPTNIDSSKTRLMMSKDRISIWTKLFLRSLQSSKIGQLFEYFLSYSGLRDCVRDILLSLISSLYQEVVCPHIQIDKEAYLLASQTNKGKILDLVLELLKRFSSNPTFCQLLLAELPSSSFAEVSIRVPFFQEAEYICPLYFLLDTFSKFSDTQTSSLIPIVFDILEPVLSKVSSDIKTSIVEFARKQKEAMNEGTGVATSSEDSVCLDNRAADPSTSSEGLEISTADSSDSSASPTDLYFSVPESRRQDFVDARFRTFLDRHNIISQVQVLVSFVLSEKLPDENVERATSTFRSLCLQNDIRSFFLSEMGRLTTEIGLQCQSEIASHRGQLLSDVNQSSGLESASVSTYTPLRPPSPDSIFFGRGNRSENPPRVRAIPLQVSSGEPDMERGRIGNIVVNRPNLSLRSEDSLHEVFHSHRFFSVEGSNDGLPFPRVPSNPRDTSGVIEARTLRAVRLRSAPQSSSTSTSFTATKKRAQLLYRLVRLAVDVLDLSSENGDDESVSLLERNSGSTGPLRLQDITLSSVAPLTPAPLYHGDSRDDSGNPFSLRKYSSSSEAAETFPTDIPPIVRKRQERRNRLEQLLQYFDLNFLWISLSEYLSLLEEKSVDVRELPVSLLPVIESLVILFSCGDISSTRLPLTPFPRSSGTPGFIPPSSPFLHTSVRSPGLYSYGASSSNDTSVRGSSSTSDLSAVQQFGTHLSCFFDANSKLLNKLIARNPSLLSGSLNILLKMPRYLDFENKRAFFRQNVQNLVHRNGSLEIMCRRNRVFGDSFRALRGIRGSDLRVSHIRVSFENEAGVDAGGLTREWFVILAREMFNPDYALFIYSFENTYQPNPMSSVNIEHLDYFRFVGNVIGLALITGNYLDAHFTRSLYKHILGQPLSHTDLESIDPDYYRSLRWILDNNVDDLSLRFIYDHEEFGQTRHIELKPDGANIDVTEANKHEYVQLISEAKMTTSISSQVRNFLHGIYEVIPRKYLRIFNAEELELLLSGLPEIDVEDWRINTVYRGYTSSSPQIEWFWKTVDEFSSEERALLLQFCTGTSKLPLGGFAQLPGMNGVQCFQIHRAAQDGRLPTSHTCFNQLDLPEYDSSEELTAALRVAVKYGSEGFLFA